MLCYVMLCYMCIMCVCGGGGEGGFVLCYVDCDVEIKFALLNFECGMS